MFTAWIIPCSRRARSDIESGLRIGDFVNQSAPNHSCVARSSRLDPPSPEVICCLAGIPGESRDSGLRLGLDGRAESREILACSRTNYGRNFRHVSESRSGLIMGDFPTSLCSERLALEPSSHSCSRKPDWKARDWKNLESLNL